jgi:hypothetical protein
MVAAPKDYFPRIKRAAAVPVVPSFTNSRRVSSRFFIIPPPIRIFFNREDSLISIVNLMQKHPNQRWITGEKELEEVVEVKASVKGHGEMAVLVIVDGNLVRDINAAEWAAQDLPQEEEAKR